MGKRIDYGEFNQEMRGFIQVSVREKTVKYFEKVKRVRELEQQINNFLTFGEGGAGFKESQLLNQLRQMEERAEKAEAEVERLREERNKFVATAEVLRKYIDSALADLLMAADPTVDQDAWFDKANETLELYHKKLIDLAQGGDTDAS